MLAQRRPLWPTLLLLGALAMLILVATSVDLRHTLAPRAEAPLPAEGMAALERKIEARVCVTRYGICAGPAARVGDPCTCPHVLRGLVPGHVEVLGSTPSRPDSADWGRGNSEEDPHDWGALAGP